MTGASGFIGNAFCRMAIASGHQILALDRGNGSQVPRGCEKVKGSLQEMPWAAIRRFKPDAALHLAWALPPEGDLNSPLHSNLAQLSASMFEELVNCGVDHLAGLGTGIEYAPSDCSLKESQSPLGPQNAYARGKVETSQSLQRIAEKHSLCWSWFRVFYAYGLGENCNRFVPGMLRKLAAGEPVILKSPYSLKDYVNIRDVAEGLLMGMESRLEGPVNVASGRGIAILDLAREAANTVGVDPGVVLQQSPLLEDPFPVTVADISKLKSTGWSPKVDVSDGLNVLWRSLQHND